MSDAASDAGAVSDAVSDAASDDELDCLSCSACCRVAGPGHILVPAQDLVRWRSAGRQDLIDGLVEGHFSELAFPSRADGACLHLGTELSPHACSIYAERGTTCREFEKGSPQCHSYRREAGLETERSKRPPRG